MTVIAELLERNRKPSPQVGQRVETPTAWHLRYYTNEVYTTGKRAGKRKQRLVMLAPKNGQYRSWADVVPIIRRILDEVNADREGVTADTTLTDFIGKQYLPWVEANKSAATANDYKRRWENSWKSHVGNIGLTELQTSQVTAVLTKHAKDGKGNRTLSHMLRILEPLDLRAAVAVAAAYFAALRPAEIRGLMWSDYDGGELNIKRRCGATRLAKRKRKTVLRRYS